HAAGEYPDVARAIAEAVGRYRSALILVGKSDSMLIEAGRDAGLSVAQEAFADRRYQADGNPVPRRRRNALLRNPQAAAEQAVSIARDGIVGAEDGPRVAVHADTICIHGDTQGAPALARLIRERLKQESIDVAPMCVAERGGGARSPMEKYV